MACFGEIGKKFRWSYHPCRRFYRELEKHYLQPYISIEQFEFEWKKLLGVHKMSDDTWLNGIREMWIPIFFKHVFFGRMSKIKRSESFNELIKQHVTQGVVFMSSYFSLSKPLPVWTTVN